jgi:hypothetical protein
VFVSFDDGVHWSLLGGNLPTAWITDLLVHGDDLIAATQGRALWVLDDVTPLRETLVPGDPAHLFTPALAWRVHADNNVDTPLPPETPIGQNPPTGAIIDYWLGSAAQGPVTLEIRDARGQVVRRFASDMKESLPDADRYFAAGWVKPPQRLETSPGLHRFVWNLRTERPPAISYSYSIAAIWGRDTPILPQGPCVVPGDYQVVLRVGRRSYSTPLRVSEDPRVRATPADLEESFDLSERIAQALGQARTGYAERKFVLKQLDVQVSDQEKSADDLHALAGRIPRKPASGEPTFEAVDEILTGVESDLEAVDAAPTAAQRLAVADALSMLADAQRLWDAVKSGPLAALSSALARAGRKQITIPPASALDTEPPDGGQDLP